MLIKTKSKHEAETFAKIHSRTVPMVVLVSHSGETADYIAQDAAANVAAHERVISTYHTHGGSMVGSDGVTYYQHSSHPGMSLRAYFAGLAMQGMIAGRKCELADVNVADLEGSSNPRSGFTEGTQVC